nr:signal peptidase I [Pacificimonas pallii]
MRTILLAIMLALGIRTFIFEPFSIPSASMQPSLLAGDYVLVAKYPYGYSQASLPWRTAPFTGRRGGALPDRGDVAVFTDPRGSGTNFVKRIIGLPGDTVQVRGGQLILNGTPVPRTRIADAVIPVTALTPCDGGGVVAGDCVFPQYRETLSGVRSIRVLDSQRGSTADDTALFTVPENHLFVMGDNRDNSDDSRAREGFGMIPMETLVGRTDMIFLSVDGSARFGAPSTWLSAIRWDRLGQRL